MSDRWMDKLWDAVEEAIIANVDPKTFKQELRVCWREALKQEAERADKLLRDEP